MGIIKRLFKKTEQNMISSNKVTTFTLACLAAMTHAT